MKVKCVSPSVNRNKFNFFSGFNKYKTLISYFESGLNHTTYHHQTCVHIFNNCNNKKTRLKTRQSKMSLKLCGWGKYWKDFSSTTVQQLCLSYDFLREKVHFLFCLRRTCFYDSNNDVRYYTHRSVYHSFGMGAAVQLTNSLCTFLECSRYYTYAHSHFRKQSNTISSILV